MKICFWVTEIFKLGGTKRVVTVLSNALAKEHDVTIMTYDSRFEENRSMYGMDEAVNVDFIDNYHFKDYRHNYAFFKRKLVIYRNSKSNKYNVPNARKLNALEDAFFPKSTQDKWVEYLNEQNYDVIIATASGALKLAMISDRLNAKTVGWQHNCYDGYINVPDVVFWHMEELLKKYLPKLDKYIVLSEYDKIAYMEKLGIETEVKINPRSFTTKEKCDPSSKRFLVCTRFVHAKGLDLLMKSFKQFCETDKEWVLDIVGDGPLFMKIVKMAKNLGILERVNFYGYSKNVNKYYQQSSLFLLPSRWEGWPMVIMEAFEYGLPVIAYHMGSMDLMIDDGKTGLLPKAFLPDRYAAAMTKLAHDDELRKQMSENALKKSDDFDIRYAVADWNDLFERITKN